MGYFISLALIVIACITKDTSLLLPASIFGLAGSIDCKNLFKEQ